MESLTSANKLRQFETELTRGTEESETTSRDI